MRRFSVLLILLAAGVWLLFGCSGSESESDGGSKKEASGTSTEMPPKPAMDIPVGTGALYVKTGPESPEILSRGFYHMREAFPMKPFKLGAYEYVLMDSVDKHTVVHFAEFTGFDLEVDSLDPGAYHFLFYVSRLNKNTYKLDTILSEDERDTIITDPAKGMPAWDYYFMPIMVTDVVISAGAISYIDLSESLVDWNKPKQTADGGWEAPRAVHQAWAGRTWR